LQYNGYWVSFPGVKRPGRGVDHPPPSSARVKERVELYLYSPSGSSWSVRGRTLPFYIQNSLFCILSITRELWHHFLGFFINHAQCFLDAKTIIRIVLGLGSRSSCRVAFRELDILTVPSLYIYALKISVVNNPDSFQSNSTIHCINTRQKNQLHLPTVKFSSIQKGVIYASIKYLTTYHQIY
jgi:hypothetical protein